ncbi:MAG: class I SAM-dependent methyltransferase [Desulfamplus sp.]|nr:class I SAM-dependent methyltransferase [Desulfamplus sp.]
MIFDRFPKERPLLPPAYRELYSRHYRENRCGTTPASFLSQQMESWLHRKVAADVRGVSCCSTLEIGAGTLNHLTHETTRPYDIVEPFVDLYQDSPMRHRVRHIYQDLDMIPGSNRYQRILAIAVFEHLMDLPRITARTCLLLESDGVLRVSIPNEGTLWWNLACLLTTGLEFRLRHGLDYRVLTRYEHLNTADEIEAVLTWFYRRVTLSCCGINRHHAFYRFYACRRPDMSRALAYLASRREHD